MKTITTKQIGMIHGLLKSANLAHQKINLVLGFTNQQTESVSEMNVQEADAFIKYLFSQIPQGAEVPKNATMSKPFDEEAKKAYHEKCKLMRNKILAEAHHQGWQIQAANGSMVVDLEHLNNFLIKYVGEPLNQLSAAKLQKAITQLEAIRLKQLEK